MDRRPLHLVIHPKGRTVFRPMFPLVIQARGEDISMSQPLLDFGNIGIIVPETYAVITGQNFR